MIVRRHDAPVGFESTCEMRFFDLSGQKAVNTGPPAICRSWSSLGMTIDRSDDLSAIATACRRIAS
jgi:hypothetical protein